MTRPGLQYLPCVASGHVAQVTLGGVHLFDPDFIMVERDRLREQAARCDAEANPFTRWADEIDSALRAIGAA